MPAEFGVLEALRKARAVATVDLELGHRHDLDDAGTTFSDDRCHAIDILGKLTGD